MHPDGALRLQKYRTEDLQARWHVASEQTPSSWKAPRRGGPQMRIVALEAVPFQVPLKSTLTSALGEQRSAEYGLIRLTTEDGTEGVGEISLVWHGYGARLCDVVNQIITPSVVGMDVFEYNRILDKVHLELRFAWHSLTAVAGIEMAILDAQGKLTGQTVTNLLGGRSSDRVRLTMSLSIASVDDCVKEAQEYVEAGFTAVKVKADRDRSQVVETVAALRRTFGEDLGIRVDMNMACHTAKEALGAIRMLEAYDVLSVEQPLSPDDHDGLAFLRERTILRLMVDESVWGPIDAKRILARGAADIINIYVAESGGIRPAKFIADMATLHRVDVAVGSMPELGCGTSAAAHLAFSLPGLEHPSDVAGMLYHSGDVVATSLEITDGFLLPPTRPGLGIEIDEEQLDYYTIRR